jgi:hypothetical protein
MREAQEVRFQREQDRIEADLTPEEVEAQHQRYQEWFKSSGQFPHVAKLFESGVDPDDPETRDERFQFSLDCVLDGVGTRLSANHAPPPAPAGPPPAAGSRPAPAPHAAPAGP